MILAYEYCLPLHKFAKDKSQSKSLKGYTLQTTNPKPPTADDLRWAGTQGECLSMLIENKQTALRGSKLQWMKNAIKNKKRYN